MKDEIRKGIWEMHHARNVIVHRPSCADRTFVAACPQFGVKIGDLIPIDHDRLMGYANCLAADATAITYRMGARCGVDMGPQS